MNKSIDSERSKIWKIKRSTGEQVPLRIILGGIICWIDRFKQIGDNLVQYDPVHSALPWAAVRFCLDVALSDVQNYNAYIDGLEQISKLIAEYAEYQNALLAGRSNLKKQLEAAIVALYLAILTYLAEARRYLESSTGRRLARNVSHGSTPKAVELLAAIEKYQVHSQRLVAAVQHEISYRKLSDVERSVQGMEALLRRPVLPLPEKRSAVLRRLAATFTNDTFDAALTRCQPSTASWIFDRPAYSKWADVSDSTSRLLWIYGPPGTGKTILSANIIRSLQHDLSRSTSYFFCVHEDETRRNPNAIIRSCLAQLVEQVDLAAFTAYQFLGKNTHRPLTNSEVWLCFAEVCKEVPNCTLVIDGYDECLSEGPMSRTFDDDAKSSFLRRLMDEISKTQAHVLLVSRDDADIRTELSSGPPTNVVMSQYSIQKVDQEQDLQTITQKLINERLSDRPQDIRDEIAQNAIDKSDGMMLWIHLLAKELRPKANAKALRRIVSEMPAGIEQAYERDLARLSLLSGDDKAQAIYILRWLLFSSRPMTVGEVVEALIMINAEDDDDYPTDELPDDWDEGKLSEDFVNDLFRRILGSLIDIRKTSEDEPVLSHTLHFVHFSVKEYLLNSTGNGWTKSVLKLTSPSEEHTKLASTCLRYLCFDVFDGSVDRDVAGEGTSTLGKYPFSLYAAQNWFWHSSHQNPIAPELVPLIETLLNPEKSNWHTWSKIFEVTIEAHTTVPELDGDEETRKIRTVKTDSDDRVWFSITKLMKLAELDEEGKPLPAEQSMDKIEQDQEYDPKTPRPMYYAGLLGIVDLVKTMWSRGYELREHPGKLGNLLHVAAYQGHVQIVAYLIEQGVDIQQKAGPFSYAIIAAAAAGFDEMVQLLLSHGADVNCKDREGNAAIHFAAGYASLNVLQTLVHKGADLNLTNGDGVGALHLATTSGKADAVRILLDAGSDVSAFAPSAWFTNTALHIAILGGFEDIVLLLLERGADVHQVSYVGSTCLHLAILSEKSNMVDVIMATDVQINQKDYSGITALHCAVMLDDEDVYRKLMERTPDLNAVTLDGVTPLILAFLVEKPAIIAQLIERGANVNLVSEMGFSPLSCAILVMEDCDMVRLLINNGVDVSRPFMDVSPLQLAITDGHEGIAKVLIEGGADINYRRVPSAEVPIPPTSLDLACVSDGGNTTIVKLLLAKGAGVNTVPPSNDYTRALSLMVEKNPHAELIPLLLDHGADPLAVETEHTWTVLDFAVKLQSQRAMRFILPHVSVWPKLLPTLSGDASSAVLLIETLLTNDIEVFRAALSSTKVSQGTALLSQLLILATIFNAGDAIDYLLKQGASISHADQQGRTVTHYAALRADEELLKQVIAQGAPVNTLDSKSHSPFHFAMMPGNPNAFAVEMLLRRECEIDAESKPVCNPTLIQYWQDNIHCLRGESIANDSTMEVAPFEITPWPEAPEDDVLNKPPRFTGFRQDEALPLKVFGYLHGDDGITWYHLAVSQGSIQRGKIDFKERKIVTTGEFYGVMEPGSFVLFFETRKERDERLVREKREKEEAVEKAKEGDGETVKDDADEKDNTSHQEDAPEKKVAGEKEAAACEEDE